MLTSHSATKVQGNVIYLRSEAFSPRAKSLASQVNDIALDFGGTVTGEHGIGSGKRSYMEREHGEAWSIMGNIKELFDPNNIMNPGKLVP